MYICTEILFGLLKLWNYDGQILLLEMRKDVISNLISSFSLNCFYSYVSLLLCPNSD